MNNPKTVVDAARNASALIEEQHGLLRSIEAVREHIDRLKASGKSEILCCDADRAVRVDFGRTPAATFHARIETVVKAYEQKLESLVSEFTTKSASLISAVVTLGTPE